MIVYVGIFSVILFVIVQLFWQMQISSIKGNASAEVKENISQFIEIFKYNIRNSDSIDETSSVFNGSPGKLFIEDDETIIFDTYSKDIIINDRVNTITKLRYKKGADPYIDLTSDRVDVENFVLRNLTQQGSNIIGLELTLSYLNPENDYLYNNSLTINTSAVVRKET